MAKKSKINVSRLSRVCYGIRERANLNPVTRWCYKYLKIRNQVSISYKRLHVLKMPLQQIEWLLLKPFRVATVTTMEHSTTLETTVTGGVQRRTQQQMPGTGT
jgi:hypothetical protein